MESNIYRNNIDYIYSKYDDTRVDKDLLWMIGKITENKDIIELSDMKEGESIDMCEAWKKFYEGARQEGFKMGNRSATIDSIIEDEDYVIDKTIQSNQRYIRMVRLDIFYNTYIFIIAIVYENGT